MLSGTGQINELIQTYWTTGKAKLSKENASQVYKRAAEIGRIEIMQDMDDNCPIDIDPQIKKASILSILQIAPQPIMLLYLHDANKKGITSQMRDEFLAFAIKNKLIEEPRKKTSRAAGPPLR